MRRLRPTFLCPFAVNKEKFDAAGASIIGVSWDSIARLNAFSADPEYCGGNVAVASDPAGTISDSYGLTKTNPHAGMKDSRGAEIDHEFTEWVTFIVTQETHASISNRPRDDPATLDNSHWQL